MFTTPTDKQRQAGQCEEILDILKRRPMYNTELVEMAMNHTARISQLRNQGYHITCSRVKGTPGLTQYHLMGKMELVAA